MRKLLSCLTIAVLASLLVAASASAALYTVTTSGDQNDQADDGCDVDLVAAGNQCTLRAAIQSANANASADVIRFDKAEMDLAGGRTITVANTDTGAGSLPTITEAVEITTESTCAGTGACIEVRLADDAGSILTIGQGASSTTKVKGLRLTHAATGISLPSAGVGLYEITGNAFGTRLDGTLDPVAVGVASSSSLGTITQNTFTGGSVGVSIYGGNSNALYGNRFGLPLKPDDTPTDATRLVHGVVITGPADSVPQGNRIGGGRADVTHCVEGCNLFATSSSSTGSAIRLAPLDGVTGDVAAGSTEIFGNFVGIPASGTTCAANGRGWGIYVGDADGITIGDDDSRRNYIGCGDKPAVESGASSTYLVIRYARLGVMPGGSSGEEIPAPVSAAGVPTARIAGSSSLSQLHVGGSGAGGAGLEINGPVDVAESDIGGLGDFDWGISGPGILVTTSTGAGIHHSSFKHVGSDGIRVAAGDGTRILGNEIGGLNGTQGSGGDGIHVEGATGVRIGDPDDTLANRFYGNARDAIRIVGDGADHNTVFRNEGDGNAEQFVDLGPDGPGNDTKIGPNDGILGPSVQATPAGASGTAEPGAVVRVFKKFNDATSDLGDQVAKVTADSSGTWNATFSPELTSGYVGATQTDTDGNTSEVTVAATNGVLALPADATLPDVHGDPPGEDDDDGSDQGTTGQTTDQSQTQQPADQPQGPAPGGGPVIIVEPPFLGPTPAQRAAAARAALDRVLAAIKRGRVLRSKWKGAVRVRDVAAIEAGTLRFTAVAGTTRVFLGTVRFTGPGKQSLTVKLTKKGRRVVRRAKRLKLLGRVTFRSASGVQSGAQRRLTLRRG